MKVMILMPSGSVIGGIETWLGKIVSGFQARGWQPQVGLVHGVNVDSAVAYLADHQDFPAIFIGSEGLNVESRIRKLMRVLVRSQPDVFIPLTVMDGHDAVCRLKLTGKAPRYLFSLRGNLGRQIADIPRYAPFVDMAICPGILGCRMMEQQKVPADRIRHVRNGASRGNGRGLRSAQSCAPIRLGYIGRLGGKDKRSSDLIGLCENLQHLDCPFTLDIVGDGSMRSSVEAGLSRFIEDGTVRIHGAVPHQRVIDEKYSEIDVLISCSSSEAFGISIFEAMAAGVVTVSSEFIGLKAENILRHEFNCLLYNVGDMKAAAMEVKKLSDSKDLLDRLSKEAVDSVQGITWDNCVEGWMKALEECVCMPEQKGLRPPRETTWGVGAIASAPIPGILKDGYFRLKPRLSGIPEAIQHGAEWPWHTGQATEEQLAQIEKSLSEMDYRAGHV